MTRLVVILGLFLLLRFLLARTKSRQTSARRSDTADQARLGAIGETFVERELKRKFRKFPVLKNVYVPYMGKTTEIDLVMIHESGIFIFESKNYGGWIFGDADQPYWMQSFPNGKKRLFYNPVMQNRTHINALSHYLNMPAGRFHSCVVFSDRCSFKKIPPNTPSVLITRYAAMAKQLRNTISRLPPVFGKKEIKTIRNQLLPCTSVKRRVKEKHIRDIIDAQSAAVCPYCGGELIRRQGPYGAFLSCRDYPRCAYTRQIEK